MTFPVEVRRVETPAGETGGPDQDRTEVTYVLGAVIDDGFAPFLTKPGGYIDTLAEADRQAQADSDDKATKSSKAGGTSKAAQGASNG